MQRLIELITTDEPCIIISIAKNSVSEEYRKQISGYEEYTDQSNREHLYSPYSICELFEELNDDEVLADGLLEEADAIALFCDEKKASYFRLTQ